MCLLMYHTLSPALSRSHFTEPASAAVTTHDPLLISMNIATMSTAAVWACSRSSATVTVTGTAAPSPG